MTRRGLWDWITGSGGLRGGAPHFRAPPQAMPAAPRLPGAPHCWPDGARREDRAWPVDDGDGYSCDDEVHSIFTATSPLVAWYI